MTSFTSEDSNKSNETFGKNATFTLPQLIGSMSISPSGRDVVLGSREGLRIIDLDSPYSPPRFLPHRTPWEVADVQWSPFADRDYWVVSTSNQKALVWNLNLYGWRNSIEHVLHGHTRAITDINFSAHHPDKLATCAVDSFVHCWDLRCPPTRPVNSFSDWFAGATQVKWSRQDEHMIASSHDKYLHIWDDRKGAYPARTIEAHNTKIYGIDWNRFEPSKIVTCSLDRTIKFWDTNNPEDLPERVIETTFPVWRARHTPFGWGLMVMPQRGNGDLHLFDRRAVNDIYDNGRVKPVHVFAGHKGQVKEFLWRAFGTVKDSIDHRDFQLVSWGTDHDLKLHAVSEHIFEDIGYEKGISKHQRLRFTRRGAKYRTFRDEPSQNDAAIPGLPRADSFPASSQLLRVKGRPSTTMGMSRVPVTQFKGWLQAGKGRRTDMHGKSTGRPENDPMSWMKNVKIHSWDSDALADEITQVGEKFKKIDFEILDVSQRKATVSLQGPWGEAGHSVYMRVDLKFPRGYPRTAHALIYVQRTNAINSGTQKAMSDDIRKIAEAYKLRGRGCVEAVVRYLLREQTLEHILTWITRDSLTDSKIIESVYASQEASDDSEDDQLDSAPNVIRSNANANVPLAKGCAALWAENGTLVCFFKLEDREPASFLGALGTGQLDESDSSKLFGGFGKFQVDSPGRRAKDPIEQTNEGSDSDTSDHSSVFSTSSSSSDSSIGFEERNRFIPWQRTTLDSLQRGRSADGSQRSTTLEGTRVGDSAQRAVLSIYDLKNILPTSQTAASDYQLQGDPVIACKRNSEVAMHHSLHDTALIWRLASVVTSSTASEQIEDTLQANPDLLILVKRITSQITRSNKSSHVEQRPVPIFPDSTTTSTRNYLNTAMMQFLDRGSDIQMLAMLSAMFLRSQQAILKDLSIQDSRHLSLRKSTAHEFSVNSLSQPSGHNSNRRESNAQTYDPRYSVSSETLQGYAALSSSAPTSTTYTGRLTTAHFSSEAPSVVARDPSGVVSTLHSAATSIAGSPESYRLSRRSETSNFPAATARLHALTRSRPGSPPGHRGQKDSARTNKHSKSLRSSPDDNSQADPGSRFKSSLSLANVSGYAQESQKTRAGRNSLKPILKNCSEEIPVRRLENKKKKRLRTRLNTATYVPIHESKSKPPQLPSLEVLMQCLHYVQQYVTLLEVWQLWVQRVEMVELCTQISDLLHKLTTERSTSTTKPIIQRGLQIHRCCPDCEAPLAPIEKNSVAIGWHCVTQACSTRNTRPSKKQRCSICEVIVTGLSVPCFQCGHLTCYQCAQEWFGSRVTEPRKRSNSTTRSHISEHDLDPDKPTCPAGCGCTCASLTEIAVPLPLLASNEAEEGLRTSPTTPRSEGFQDTNSSNRPSAVAETQPRNHRGQSIGHATGGSESALNALLALQVQSRQRSTSSAQISATTIAQPTTEVAGQGTRRRDNSISVVDELLPWESNKNATLGKGYGAGLSRGLSNKGSDVTLRRATRR